MSKIIKISLKPKSGLITEMQSDTLFGHFCWRLKELKGETTLENFLELYKNNEPVFTISNSLYTTEKEIYFPAPNFKFKYEESGHNSKQESINQFLEFKDKKSNQFIALKTLNNFLIGKLSDYDTINLPKDSIKENIYTSSLIDRESLKAKEGNLHSFNSYYYDKLYFSILIKVLDEKSFDDFNCLEILKYLFEIGFGKKKSTGYGVFEITDINENYNDLQEPESSNGFYSLSNYFPHKSDNITNGYYRLFTKFPKMGEVYATGGNPFKKSFTLIKPGAVFFTNENKNFYGSIIENISFQYDNIIQNCYAFTLKLIINND